MTRRRVSWRGIAAILAVVLVSVSFESTFAAFRSTAESSANSYTAGTVFLSGNGGAGSFPGSTGAEPGAVSSGCVIVTYSGSLPANVRIYTTRSGTIAPYLSVKITRGSGAAGFPSCTGFTADPTNYAGLGAGVLFDGLASTLPTSGATGLLDPTAGTPETWATGEAHAYRFDVTVTADPAGQGRTGTLRFGFQAANI